MLGYQRACEPKDDSNRITSGKETFLTKINSNPKQSRRIRLNSLKERAIYSFKVLANEQSKQDTLKKYHNKLLHVAWHTRNADISSAVFVCQKVQ